MVFGVKAVTYAIKHGLGSGTFTKKQKLSSKSEKYPPLDVIFHST